MVAGLGLVALAIELAPRAPVPWVTAVPLLVAGIGSGLVIAPNQTLTLSQVPVPQAGSGAGMLQTGQRIGSAAGIAVVGAVFFSIVSEAGAPWSKAFERSLLVSAGIITLALLVALIDIARHRVKVKGRAPS